MKAFNLLAVLYGLALVALLVAKVVVPGAPYLAWLTELTLLRMGALAKILFLGMSALFAHQVASSFDRDNSARLAWRLLGIGLTGFFLGQGYLAFHQIALGATSPYPSPADVGFMVGYPFLLAAFWRFISAYRDSGFPVGSPREHAVIALLAALAFGAIGVVALGPVVAAPAPPLEKALNLAYPTFDFLILIPLVILLRVTVPFRGGRIWTVWAGLLAGFAAMAAGDILYAYFVTLGRGWLEAIIDVLFIASYILVAQATLKQRELLAS